MRGTDRFGLDGRTFDEAVEENLADLRAHPHIDWVGADAHEVAGYLECWRRMGGGGARGAVIAEALWRHYEELNP